MNPQQLVLQNISFCWPRAEQPLFTDISLCFEQGIVFAIMGSNGTGKTTLLEVIARRVCSNAGRVMLGGVPAVPSDFNYIPQDSARLLFAHLTLAENIALQRVVSSEAPPQFLQDLFPSESTLSRYPTQCSGGQRQRATVARAVMDIPNFPVTLLDESFAQLSREAKAILGPIIRNTARRSKAIVIFVTHDLLDAMKFGDRVVALTSGQLTSFDTSHIETEEDCWRESQLREDILRNLLLSDFQIK